MQKKIFLCFCKCSTAVFLSSKGRVRDGKFFGLIFGLVGLFICLEFFSCCLSRALEFHVLIRCYGNQVLGKTGEKWLTGES